jgi:ABC-type transport system involved in multi-copper enzyme maturation permease subunit
MLKTIIEKEIRDIIGSTKFAVTFGVCAVLILLSFFAGANNYQVSRARYEAAKTENLRQFAGLTDWFSVRQHRIFLPPQPLGTLVTGISNDIGRTTEITGRGELTPDDSRFNEDPLFAVFRFLDLDFLFGVVLSLLAILFGFDAISGEKERGTLRLVLANAVPRGTYVLGRLCGSFIALAAPLVATVVLGCLLLPVFGIALTGGEWLRLGLVLLAGLLYFGVFLTVAVFVSAVTHRSSSSFLVLLVVWILAVMIVPRAAVLLAGRAVEVPAVDELDAQKAAFGTQLWREHREKLSSFKPTQNDDMQGLMDEFNRFMNDLADERDNKMQEFAGRLNEDRQNRQQVQRTLAFSLARISPAAQLSLAVSSLAGTSLELKEHYLQEATAYQAKYAQFMKEKTGINTGGGMMVVQVRDEGDEEPEPIDLGELPVFEFRPVGFARSLGAAIVDLGLLALGNLVFFAAAFVAFGRYDVR